MKLGISIPTYNEATNIAILLTQISEALADTSGLDTTVVVVDDNSPDGTADIVEKAAKKLNRKTFTVTVHRRAEKDGFGRACVAGFKNLLNAGVDYVLQMDADLSHNPAYLPAFVKAAKEKTDFVVASRYIKGGDTPDWPLHRRLLSRYGNFYARTFLSQKVTDYTGGFNMYSAKLLKAIELDKLRATGYGFLIELKFKALQNARTFSEIPIVFTDRQHGQSKIPKSTLIKNLVLVPQIRVQHLTKRK